MKNQWCHGTEWCKHRHIPCPSRVTSVSHPTILQSDTTTVTQQTMCRRRLINVSTMGRRWPPSGLPRPKVQTKLNHSQKSSHLSLSLSPIAYTQTHRHTPQVRARVHASRSSETPLAGATPRGRPHDLESSTHLLPPFFLANQNLKGVNRVNRVKFCFSLPLYVQDWAPRAGYTG